MNVKIADFGMSCVKCLDAEGERGKRIKKLCESPLLTVILVEGPVGSPFYMAPEVSRVTRP